ncbi:MAG: hypothetical protein RIB53_14460 [Roseitalea porphyridii]|jgi:hypothetical protein|uniref:hypothetical protein n=1 Tax=Roseitalea porphyridii TaxID=1852022 RepID=UPI0032EDB9B5
MTGVRPDTLLWGNDRVPVIRRAWPSVDRQPYRKTYSLKPGQFWFDADTTDRQWESYALDACGTPVPVGALIAQELKRTGASHAGFTEIWHGFVVVDHSLRCVEPDGALAWLIDSLREANNGKLSGFPDAFAVFEDGSFAFREAKNLSNKDRLNANQHRMADLLRELLPGKCDLAVVEWG